MNNNRLILLIIIIFTFFLRFILLDKIPPVLNRDEASIGYNAYSLLKTTKDEHGIGPWPLVFRAFGDYKIPGYIYMVTPLIKLLGLHEVSVRFPAAFFGSLTILVFYWFIKELFPKKESLALLSALILSLSPFHLHYSRQAFEATVALFFSLSGILFLLKSRKQIIFLIPTLGCFITAFFTYNTPLLLLPLLTIWTLYIFRKDYIKIHNFKVTLLIFGMFYISILGFYRHFNGELNKSRANTTIFFRQETKELLNRNIFILNKKGFPIFLARIYNNKPFYWMTSFIKSYLAVFNPKFIFITSDNNPWHSLGNINIGNIYIIFLPFILIGLHQVVRHKQEQPYLWLLGYFFLSPIPSAITIDSPITTRLLDFHLILALLAAQGLLIVWQYQCKHNALKNLAIFITTIFFVSNYLLSYFFIFPQDPHGFWLPGIKQATQIIKDEEKSYDYVIFDPNVELAYIFLAYYLPFDPQDFQSQAQRHNWGYDTVNTYNKYIFDGKEGSLRYEESLIDKKSLLMIYRLQFDYNLIPKNNEIIVYDTLGRALWKITKIKI